MFRSRFKAFGPCRTGLIRRPNQLRPVSLEERLVPAELLHARYPDATGPQRVALFGESTATGSNYRVVGVGDSSNAGLVFVGQAFVYDAATNKLIAILNNPEPAAYD